VGVVHNALNVVATSSNDVRVVRVADVHFHDHPCALLEIGIVLYGIRP